MKFRQMRITENTSATRDTGSHLIVVPKYPLLLSLTVDHISRAMIL